MAPRWLAVPRPGRRLGSRAAAVAGLTGLLSGAGAPLGTIPVGLQAAAVAPPPEIGIEQPPPFAGDGLAHVLAVLPEPDGERPPAKPPTAPAEPRVDIAALALLSAAGTIVRFEQGADGSPVAVYDDGRRATVRNGMVEWLDGAPSTSATTATPTTAPAPTSTPTAAVSAPGVGGRADGLPDRLLPLAGRADVRSVEDLGGGIWRFNGTFDPTELRRALEAAGAATVEDHVAQVLSTDDYYPYQWNLENGGPGPNLGPTYVADADIDAERVAAGATGAGVVVAVIDSGANLAVTDLAGTAWRNGGEVCANGADDDANGYVDDCSGWNTADDNATLWASGFSSHGTSVASIIAAQRGNGTGIAGIAPGVRIMNLAAMPSGSGYESDIIEAMNYAIDNGADVINLSLGRAGGTCGAAYEAVLARAEANDVVVAVAAGNSGQDLATQPAFPAACPGALLSVGSSAGDDSRSPFSNYGAALVDLMAPGSTIPMLSGTGSVVSGNGTSMAAPHVAAVAALVLEQHPDWDESAVRQRLLTTVEVKAGLSGTSATGGRLNAADAVGSPSPTTTVAPTTTTRAPLPANPWQVRFSGFGHPSSSIEGTISVEGADADRFGAGVHWQLSVYAIVGDATYGVVGLPVSVDGVAARTGLETARVALGEQTGSFSTNISAWLPPGRYAFVVEAGVASNAGRIYGRPVAVVVDVDGSSATTVTTAPNPPSDGSTTTAPGSTSPTPTTPGPTSTTPAPATTATPWLPTTAPGTVTTPWPASPSTTADTTAPTAPPAEGGGGGGGNPGGGSGGSPTTAVATTVAPIPTTAPGPTTTTGPGAAPWRPDPVTPVIVGAWGIAAIDPNWVLIDDGDAVLELRGSFPQVPTYVFVGTQQATVLHADATQLRIRPPAFSVPGVRPLSISWAGEVRISVTNGVWYVDPDGSAPPVTTAPAPTTAAPTTVPATTAPLPPPLTTSPAPPAATTTTAAPAPTTVPTTTSAPAPPVGVLRSSPIFAPAAELRSGITVRRVMGNNPLADVLGALDSRACGNVECDAFVI